MALPKIQHVTTKDKVPSTKEVITLRPFTVKEEKILLFAVSENDPLVMIDAIYQIIRNCVVAPKNFDPTKYPLFDIGYIFVKLRAISVSNVVELKYTDPDDNIAYDIDVDLNKVIVKFTDGHTNKIKINDDIGVVMSYPNMKVMLEMRSLSEQDNLVEKLYGMIASLIAAVWDGDQVAEAGKDFTEEEANDFLNSLPHEAFASIESFFNTMPTLFYEASYLNNKGVKKTVEMTELSDFLL